VRPVGHPVPVPIRSLSINGFSRTTKRPGYTAGPSWCTNERSWYTGTYSG
jgi:hypothetical protein